MPKRIRRTLLYTRADRPSHIEGGAQTNADAVIMEMRNTVPADRTEEARENVKWAVDEVDFGDKEVCIRINELESKGDSRSSPGDWFGDLEAAIEADPDTIIIPNVLYADQITKVMGIAEQLASGDLPEFLPVVEEPLAYFSGVDIARTCARYPEITAMYTAVGRYCEVTGAPDMGKPDTYGGYNHDIFEVVSILGAGICSIGNFEALGSTEVELDDEELMRSNSEQLREYGYTGRFVIHPKQVDVVNEVFTPSEEEYEKAKYLVSEFDASDEIGMTIDGKFLDPPLVTNYRNLIERYELIQELD